MEISGAGRSQTPRGKRTVTKATQSVACLHNMAERTRRLGFDQWETTKQEEFPHQRRMDEMEYEREISTWLAGGELHGSGNDG